MVCEVLIEYSVKSLDKTFDYLIPEELKDKLKVGSKVLVNFNTKQIEGFVLKIKEIDQTKEYKEVIEIINHEFVLNQELLELGKFLKRKTNSNLISCYQTMLPKALKASNKTNINKKYISYVSLNLKMDIEKYKNEFKRNKKEIEIIDKLIEKNKLLKSELTGSSLTNLIKKEIVLEIKEEVNRLEIKEEEFQNNKLNQEQEEVLKKILNSKSNIPNLIYGVTGSGKTEVYIKLIENVLKNNKTAIMLVPEISLTPQIIQKFVSVFGSNLAILHSRLSEGEKYDEYRKILNNEVKIVIGARSAVFAPLKNLGIIIVDEEHTSTYKQENNPKYNAIDVAIERTKNNNAICVLGSATPSLETYARALKGVYSLHKLTQRYNQKSLPKIVLVDMYQEYKNKNFIISDLLKKKIEEKLSKNEQILLLLNRRGYSTYINCSSCGYVFKCPNCEITLTYHKSSNNMRCHYCGYSIINKNICPNCSEESLNNLGLGTEKLEAEIKKIFKTAKVLRMDADTTTNKNAHQKIINSFASGEYDIMIGTQMISKGLNFPNVTLVGIINADSLLNLPDFRSSERTFALLTQASGRSGRSEKEGEVVIETFNPDNYVYNYIKNYDYQGFFNYEMSIRKKLKYPPYFFITSIKVSSLSYEIARDEAQKVYKFLEYNLNQDFILLGPTVSSILKMNNKYRFNILIKYKKEQNLSEVLEELNNIYISSKVTIDIDNNPLNFI